MCGRSSCGGASKGWSKHELSCGLQAYQQSLLQEERMCAAALHFGDFSLAVAATGMVPMGHLMAPQLRTVAP